MAERFRVLGDPLRLRLLQAMGTGSIQNGQRARPSLSRQIGLA